MNRRLFHLNALLLCCLSQAGAQDAALDPRLHHFDIEPMVRFTTRDAANERRELLVRSIWPDGLPATRPKVQEVSLPCVELASVDARLIGRVQQFDCVLPDLDFVGVAFVAHPLLPAGQNAADRPRLAIVFAGHMPEGAEHYLASGLSRSIEALLREGYAVAALQMPVTGWNHDVDGRLPSGQTFTIRQRRTAGHDELLSATESELQAGFMRFFIEPCVQTVNELVASYPEHDGILMIGLSGGGWTTQLASAVDVRISVSIPVAGSLPLYARPFSPHSRGDAEQEYAPIFREEDTNNDGIPDTATGICSWLEMYMLGGLPGSRGSERRQIQVINLYDSCCFSGFVHTTYADAIEKRCREQGGRWTKFVDETHRDHLISDHVIDQVLIPAARSLRKSRDLGQQEQR